MWRTLLWWVLACACDVDRCACDVSVCDVDKRMRAMWIGVCGACKCV